MGGGGPLDEEVCVGLRGSDKKRRLVSPPMGSQHESSTFFLSLSLSPSRFEADLPHWCVNSTGAGSSGWIVPKVKDHVNAGGLVVCFLGVFFIHFLRQAN